MPFGTFIFDKLQEYGILQDAFRWLEGELSRFDLSLARLERTFEAAWSDFNGFNLGEVLDRHFGRLYRDVVGFARSLVGHIIDLIKEAVLDVADHLLAENRAWALIKKILGQDPLRGTPVEATPVEILEDFLRLIGKEQELEQMRVRGTLQETADWLATQIGSFMSLLGELGDLFSAAWEAIQPENLPNLTTNLRALASRVGGFLQRVWNFATTVAAKVLELIKNALLGWLKTFAINIPGYHLLTVILEKDVFTQEVVPRTVVNLIRGFMSLIPGGEEQFQQMQETGVIPQAAQRIEALMSELGINWPFIRGLFTGIWNSLTIDDLIDPIGAFRRITAQFGEPISRLFTFVTEVVKIIIELILVLMNFPSDIIARIINNALQAFDDIKRDPVGFLQNMLAAVRLGFSNFFDNILQHLLSGVTDWLFGQLRAAGIEPPSEITLASALDLVLQILGISMDRIWEKLAERIGQENVARIRGAIDRLTGIWNFVRDVQERGVAAIWEYIESQISNLWDMVLEQVRNWIVTRIIERVVARLISMLDPTGIMAVVNSFIAFFNAVQSAIEYFREILLIIDDYVSTVASIARGDVEPGAARLEQGLANSIPVAVGFLANQVGLGNLAEKIAEIVGGIRAVIDRALDWLLDRAVSLGQSVLSMLGLGGQEESAASAGAEEEEAVPATEAIPEGLPPEEVKRHVLETVEQTLRRTNYRSTQTVYRTLQSIYNTNRDRGLRGLSIDVVNETTMQVEIRATASPADTRSIRLEEIFPPANLSSEEEFDRLYGRLTVAHNSTYAAVAVDGHQIGNITTSSSGQHAEESLVRGDYWLEAIQTARQGVQSSGSSRLTLVINRTPCSSCVVWLKDAIRQAKGILGSNANNVVFLLAARGTYVRQRTWNREDKREFGRTFAMQIAKGVAIPEQLEEQRRFWLEDLRSQSTEWVDEDGVSYSGLRELAQAGWQIAGLEEPEKGRPLDLARIARELADEFGWDS